MRRGSVALAALLCLPLLLGPVSNTSADTAALPEIVFSQPVVFTDEGATVTLKVLKKGAGAASVRYESRYLDGGEAWPRARPSVDYTHVSGTLEFADGDTEKTFTVNIIDDDSWDPDEKQEVIDIFLEVDPTEAVRGVPGLTVIVINP
ncbi:MAG: hypothetical protein OXE03_00600 [Gammaproteobacteria bacterium]|nr:hypothetical protein [Gammaproteobacteria bacterium]MCY4281411.1 hypothetical protein [Gammaproteobacteria bacterium]